MTLVSEWFLLIVVGVLAGTMNVVAGGGSALTLPALMLLGVPASVANGTNRMAVVVQSLVGFQQLEKQSSKSPLPRILVVWTVLGAAGGSWVATVTPDLFLEPILLVLLLGFAGVLAVSPSLIFVEPESDFCVETQSPIVSCALFCVGFYGGFIQAGVGFLLLLVLTSAFKLPFMWATSFKLLVVFALSSISFFVFWAQGLIWWTEALVLTISMALGAVIGARLLPVFSKQTMRWVLFGIIVLLVGLVLVRSVFC